VQLISVEVRTWVQVVDVGEERVHDVEAVLGHLVRGQVQRVAAQRREGVPEATKQKNEERDFNNVRFSRNVSRAQSNRSIDSPMKGGPMKTTIVRAGYCESRHTHHRGLGTSCRPQRALAIAMLPAP
jgi:hypothetical protein